MTAHRTVFWIGVCAFAGWLVMYLRYQHEHEQSSSSARLLGQEADPSSSPPALPGLDVLRPLPPEDSASGWIDPLSGKALPQELEDCLSLPTFPIGIIVSSLGELDPGMEPTAVGLYSLTSEQWGQDDFRTLTCGEVGDLLTFVDGYSLVGLEPFQWGLGGLPTSEDCELALGEPAVAERLSAVCALNAALAALEFMPNGRRGEQVLWARDSLRGSRDHAERELMKQLDKVSSYKHWAVLHRAFMMWQRQ